MIKKSIYLEIKSIEILMMTFLLKQFLQSKPPFEI